MNIDFDPAKERLNKQRHGLDFSFAKYILSDPLSATVYDRFEGEEHRWHTFGWIGNKVFLVVSSNPDVDDEDWIRVFGFREATTVERRRYEEQQAD